MRALILVSVAALMAGCAAQVIDSNERMVVVKASPIDPSTAMRLAGAECEKHGRHARLSVKPTDEPTWGFDCVR